MKADGERVALVAFIAGTALAGGNAVCIRFSNRELAPLWGSGPALLARRLRARDDHGGTQARAAAWAAAHRRTFVLIPLITVALSASLDDEPVGVGLVLGGLLVVAGVYVGALRAPGEPTAAR